MAQLLLVRAKCLTDEEQDALILAAEQGDPNLEMNGVVAQMFAAAIARRSDEADADRDETMDQLDD